MGATAVAATVWNCPNFVGELYLIGANQTPFTNMIGGLQGGRVRMVKDFEFPLNQQYTLDAASQPAISETSSVTGATATTYTRAQDRNVAQIYQKKVSVSYAKQSVTGRVKVAEYGTSGYGYVDLSQGQPVANEVNFQIEANLKQIAVDVEYVFLQGTYQLGSAVATANKTRGICTACTTNTVAAGSTDLDQDHIKELIRTMAGNGSTFTNMVIFANAFQMQQISKLYGYAPEDRVVGGVAIKQIVLDIAGNVGVVYAPKMSTSVLLFADLAH